jgi:hypothetical protein
MLDRPVPAACPPERAPVISTPAIPQLVVIAAVATIAVSTLIFIRHPLLVFVTDE